MRSVINHDNEPEGVPGMDIMPSVSAYPRRWQRTKRWWMRLEINSNTSSYMDMIIEPDGDNAQHIKDGRAIYAGNNANMV